MHIKKKIANPRLPEDLCVSEASLLLPARNRPCKLQRVKDPDCPFEVRMPVSKTLGKGYVDEIRLRPGMRLFLSHYEYKTPVCFRVKAEYPAYGFRFSFSGRSRVRPDCLGQELSFGREETGFFYFPDMRSRSRELPGEPVLRVMLEIRPEVFEHITGDCPELIPPLLKPRRHTDTQDPFNVKGKMTPLIKNAVHRILNCPFQGSVKRLYLEGQALELAALTLDRFQTRSPCVRSHPAPGDVRRIQAVADLLRQTYQTPPDLNELCRFSAVSRTKLLKDFKAVYGLTPAGFTRKTRLEKARQLLDSGESNVTETAYAVGFTNISHFSAAFRDFYGISPGKFRQKTFHR